MKFYDLEWLAEKCGTDNKYEITAKIAAEARRESEEASLEKGNPINERYISNVLQEIEDGTSPINKPAPDPETAALMETLNAPETTTVPETNAALEN